MFPSSHIPHFSESQHLNTIFEGTCPQNHIPDFIFLKSIPLEKKTSTHISLSLSGKTENENQYGNGCFHSVNNTAHLYGRLYPIFWC